MFTGREYDSETGLYHYRARAYKPSIGRFLQTDPIGYADSINMYSYCGNNPLNWTDPFGLCKDDDGFWKKLWDGKYFGTGYGEDSLDHYMENIVSGNGNWYDYVGGFFAALWTPETWKATTVTAGTAVLPFPKGAQLINKGGATPVKIGQAGEEAVGISGAKTAIKINGRTRVPDQVTSEAVREVKNVNKLSYTKQLHDYVDYAQSTGKQLELHTRSSTKLSGPLNEAIGNGLIVHKFIPGM